MYRGVVTDPYDPSKLCRLAVSVPAVMGSASVWAFPHKASPSASVPIVNAGDGVWVMFEGGDSAFPVWTGFYGPDGGEGPAASHTHPLGDLPSTIATDTEVSSALTVHTGSADPHTPYILASGTRAMTGALTLNAAPTLALHASTKKYVDDGLALKSATGHTHAYSPDTHTHSYLPLSGGSLSGRLQIDTPAGITIHYPSNSVASMGPIVYGSGYGMRFTQGWAGDSGSLAPLQIGAPVDGNSAATVSWVQGQGYWGSHGHDYAASSHGAHYVQASTTVFTSDGAGQAYIGGLVGFSTVIQCNGDFAAHARAVSLRGDFGGGGFGLMNMDASKATRCNWITC
jgi:hypothetical protein